MSSLLLKINSSFTPEFSGNVDFKIGDAGGIVSGRLTSIAIHLSDVLKFLSQAAKE